MQRRKPLSFFLIKRIRALAEDRELRIHPRCKFLSRYSLKTFSLASKRLYSGLNRGYLPFISLITSLYRLQSGNNLASFLLNTSIQSLQASSRTSTSPLSAIIVIYIIKRSRSICYRLAIKDLSPSITTFQYFLLPLAL